jgi:DNA invertase Pin-like site-specific DNA recombinase
VSKPTIRCAIYTRKSSDEGLDQAFNSLDAQHEACASYIASQRHEGWKLDKTRYDDGGISGGTLNRPAVQRLLEDIDAGRIQMVVVYKIDRLTRSLTDFAKLVERLDAANCSFVSVTQAFNTSSSMGRLTLNVLLSFAQFEREVTAERIRDKIAASKKKGLWMGGVCPLGYDKDPDPLARSLVINEIEAQTVRKLFELYDNLGCLRAVEKEACECGLLSKMRGYSSGRVAGGKMLSRGQIYYILRNPIYIGRVRHKDKTYPGQHKAIISEDLWERVQQKLSMASGRRRGDKGRGGQQSGSASPSVLAGKLFDETGDRLTPSHTTRNQRRHRYYVSNRLVTGTTDPSGWRLSAPKLEHQIANLIADHLESHAQRMSVCRNSDINALEQVNAIAGNLAVQLRGRTTSAFGDLVSVVHLGPGAVEVSLNAENLASSLATLADQINPDVLRCRKSWQIRRRGVERKIIIGEYKTGPDITLIKLLDRAHGWVEQLTRGVALKAIAEQQGVTPAYIRTRSKIAFLAPKVQEAILGGTLNPEYTANRLVRMKIPADWPTQESLFLIN